MKRFLPILLLPVLATAAQAQGPANAWRIVNRTGQEAVGLVATETGEAGARGRNRLRQPVADGAERGFRRKADAPCRMDLRLRLADGREAVVREHDICASPAVTFEAALVGTVEAAPARRRAAAPPEPAASPGTGTGFVVASERVMTSQAVVEGCARVVLRGADGRRLTAVAPVRANRELGLAVLTVPGLGGPALPFRADPPRRGEGASAYGYPAGEEAPVRGEVNGLGAVRDDPALLRARPALRPGQAGAPLLDARGRVMGIATAAPAARGASLAVRAERAVAFLRAAGVTPVLGAETGPERGAAELEAIAGRSVLPVRCERDAPG